MKYLVIATISLLINLQLSAQNVGIGVTTPQSKLHVNGSIKIDSAYYLELGGRLTKESNAGKIGYALFTPETLDIVGAGTGARKIKLWNEAGVTLAGKIHIESGEITHTKTGDINNLLPVGIAGVQAGGSKQYGTSNITTSWVNDHYVIEMGEGVQGMQAFVTVFAGTNTGARIATVINGTPTAIWVYIWTLANVPVQAGFNFVAYKP